MLRQTSEQIDSAIVDSAAQTFATHGYVRTSVQQLADAVGYSKTGLLHRFASKQAIYEAALAGAGTAVDEVLATAAGAGPDRALAVLRAVAAAALERPGLVHMIVESTRHASDEPGRDELLTMVERVASVLGAGDGVEARLRCMLALKLIVDAMLAHCHEGVQIEPARLAELVVELAARVLGIPDPFTAHPSSPQEGP